jgi:predicted SnoaL-like aldol condensation-catalyzing enzyme
MRIVTPVRTVTPLRIATFAAVVSTAVALSLGVAVAAGAHVQLPFSGDQKSKACARSTHDLERNKHNVVAYYTTAFNDKNPRLAVQLYGGAEYIQHNPLAANGFDAFIQFVEGFTTAFPDVHIDIKRVFAECDFVITHSLATGAAPVFTALGTKLVDIFRVDQNGKVVEHWDVAAAISPTSANGNPEV